MFDPRPELPGNNRHISSSSSTNHAHSRHESGGDRDFNFWCSSNTIPLENDCDQHEGRSEEGYGVFSPPLWETYRGKQLRLEHSPLLPSTHHCCSLSPASRSKAIAEGRRELMEMIKDMPESSFELSLQDLVDKQHVLQQPDQNETSIDNTHIHSSNEAHIRKQKKKKKNNNNNKSNRTNQILRVESMDSGTFLLKMFFPTSLPWIRKDKRGKGSKVSPRSLFQESIKHVGSEWRIKNLFQAGEDRSDVKGSTSESTNSNDNRNRYVDRNSPPSCWPFFLYTKTKKQGGCILNKNA